MELPKNEEADLITGECEMCGRWGVVLTRHHLIPRARHRNRRARRSFDRREMKGRIALVCRPCHNQIHDLYSEKELERSFNTLDALKNDDRIQRFVEWVRKKPPGIKPVSRRPRRT